ncbi:MAG: histidine phosphatase family protein [Rubrivivax sp.]|nr:histidine phosphatase family protein [Rubrivivax sp.]
MAAARSAHAQHAQHAQHAPPQAGADAAREALRAQVAAGLRAGGVVLALRHAQAPGQFDPPGFDLARCETQRNLGDEGRAQAARIGQWLRSQGLAPVVVRTSPWCRCRDTAQIAFGRAEVFSALGSPARSDAAARAAQQASLRRALAAASARRDGFEAWVTHQFVLRDLTGESTTDGEALLLRVRPGPAPTTGALPEAEVLARAWLH